MPGYNPIALVGTKLNSNGEIADGVTLPAPTSYQYDWEDDSKDGRRVESGKMYKNRKYRFAGLSLSWEKVSISNCSKIIKAFKPEYVYVKYLDAEDGVFITREFYVGNGSAPLFNTKVGKWDNLSFKIVTRDSIL